MELGNKFFTYLKDKIPNFEKTKKNGAFLFTCPNLKNHKYTSHSPTATFIGGSDKLNCLQCGFKGTIFDVVRVLEIDKKNKSDEEITNYLIDSLEVDAFSELVHYEKYQFALVPIAKNAKIPIEKSWTDITHYDKLSWIKWLNNGLNIGIRTGKVSKITVIDVDMKEEVNELQSEILILLKETNTLVQNSPHGEHYIFVYDEELMQTTNIGGSHVDIRNDGGQIVAQPSKIDISEYHFKNLGAEIKVVSENVKSKLLSLMKLDKKTTSEVSKELSVEPLRLKNNNLDGCCNDTFVKLGGALIERLNPEQTKFVLHLLNKNILEQPMPAQSIDAMMGSLAGYKETEENSQEKMLYTYLTQMQRIHTKDAVESLKLSRAICDKYLSKFVLEGRAIRLARGYYQYREKVKWSDTLPEIMNKLTYKIPYFDFLQDFEEGDIIVLGGQPGHGKTTTSVNILKQVVEQGVKPYYIFSESGSRHYKIAKKLGLTDGEKLKFFATYHGNPLSIEIEPHSFTIIDWLMIGEKETTDMVFKHFTEEMERKGGVLIIMSQLKKTYDWYAPNMIDQFPALAARWILDSEDRTAGHWQVDKVRDCRLGVFNNVIPCDFNMETKILTAKEIV